MLEEAPATQPSAERETAPHVFVFSARTPGQLRAIAARFESALATTTASAADIAFTLQVGRRALTERLAIVADSIDALRRKLGAVVAGQTELDGVFEGTVGERAGVADILSTDRAAAEFLRYLLSQDAQLAMAKVGQMPVLSDLGEQLTSINAYYAPFVTQLATARPRTPTPAWPKIDDILKAQIQQAIQGDISVQDALDQAAAQIDPLLAKYAG